MKKIDFSSGWKCRNLTLDGEPFPVTIPHDAMIHEPRSPESVGAENIGWFAGYDYEYEKIFTVPEAYRDRKITFEFEGIYHRARVYINDSLAASRPYGYTNFYVDANEYLKYGADNKVRVIAVNHDQPNSRWYTGTGIYRPVWMYVGGKDYIRLNGLKIKTLSIDPALLEIKVVLSHPGAFTVTIKDGNDEVVSENIDATDTEISFKLNIPDAKLWNPESPHLYTCKVIFGDDEVSEDFGIRLLKWDAKRGLTINGERVILRGGCIHHDNGLLGACAFPEAEERKVRVMKEAGYNALRSAHNPCSKALLKACDRLGMLLMDEYVDVWYIHKTKYDYAGELLDWWKKDLKDMVDKDFNHPSVIMYCLGNEVAETSEKNGIQFTKDMTDYLHSLDETRPVTCGINIFFNFLYSIGLGVYSDEKAEKGAKEAKKTAVTQTKDAKSASDESQSQSVGKKPGAEEGKRSSSKKKKAHVGSDFYNTLATLVGDYFMKIGATLPPCDWKTKDAYSNMDIAGYNYGIFRYRHDLKKYPERLILGSETFCKDAYSFWQIARENPRIIGDFVWSGMEYIGEIGGGAAEYADYRLESPGNSMTGDNGRVDLLGKPRAEAAYTKVAFELEKGPFIAVKPPYQEEKLRITGWKLTKAIESWSWRGSSGKNTDVEVYAMGREAELKINGKSYGKKKLKKARAVFKVPYEDGTITAISYDDKEKKIGEHSLSTAGEKTMLSVIPEEKEVSPHGLSFIWLRYTDDMGIWKPAEKHTLKVSVKNGKLLGLGSACPYTETGYTLDSVKTYYGEAMAIIRAGEKDAIELTVNDENNEIKTLIPINS